MNKNSNSIFKNGSTTYYWSSFFFPKKVRADVADVYAFVRTADDFVDAVPQQTKKFESFSAQTLGALSDSKVMTNAIIDRFVAVAKKHSFKTEWTQAFLEAMRADTQKNIYTTYDELFAYMYGSAGVIGLMMCKILDINSKAYPSAIKQGEAMQLINFVRDINEDIELGRQYIPTRELKKHGITTLSKESALTNPADFKALIRAQIALFHDLQKQAQLGYRDIPYRFRIPIATAALLYKWTAAVIYKDPAIIFERKVKPSKLRVFATAAWATVRFR